jgi:hypothetical protein
MSFAKGGSSIGAGFLACSAESHSDSAAFSRVTRDAVEKLGKSRRLVEKHESALQAQPIVCCHFFLVGKFKAATFNTDSSGSIFLTQFDF